jgi:uncharacterized protein
MEPLELVSIGLVALIGFAAHRASLCNVRAVAQIIDARSPAMLIAFAKAIAWSAAVAGTLTIVLHLTPAAPSLRMPIVYALLGGFTFGIGAALNRGCSLSTLQRLADGDLSMLATLAGIIIGIASWTWLESQGVPTMLSPWMTPWMRMSIGSALALIVLWIFAARELWNLHAGQKSNPIRERLLAPSYHPASAAAVIGISGGLLYALHGSWTYTNLLRGGIGSVLGGTAPNPWLGWYAVALIGGMAISSLQRRSFSVRLPPREQIARHAAAGWLMGCGVALAPGGNNTLLLASIPALSMQSAAVYLALLAGIALGLKVERGIGKVAN